jgi:hypothetical protein
MICAPRSPWASRRPLTPIFTKRIDPQSEVRPAGSEDAVGPPGTDDLALPRWSSPGTAIPILDDFTMKRLGTSTWPHSRLDRARAMSSKRRTSSQRYIPDRSATRSGRRSANRLYNEARQGLLRRSSPSQPGAGYRARKSALMADIGCPAGRFGPVPPGQAVAGGGCGGSPRRSGA